MNKRSGKCKLNLYLSKVTIINLHNGLGHVLYLLMTANNEMCQATNAMSLGSSINLQLCKKKKEEEVKKKAETVRGRLLEHSKAGEKGLNLIHFPAEADVLA